MRKTVFIALLPLAFASCNKPLAENAEPAAPAAAERVVAATPLAKPAPANPKSPSSAAAPVTAATPELAPPGVFYLLTATKVETADGITGLTPGAGLKLIRPGVYLSTAGEVALRDDQVTNDMALARLAKNQDAASQVALRARLVAGARQAAAAQAARDAATPNPTQQAVTVPAAADPSAAPKPLGSSLDAPAYNATKNNIGYDSQGRKYWIDVYGHHHYNF